MKLWLDAQLPPSLAAWIAAQGPDLEVKAVRELGLRDALDREIFAAARDAGATVITKDRDFMHLLEELGPPPQVIWLRTGNSSKQQPGSAGHLGDDTRACSGALAPGGASGGDPPALISWFGGD